jgi:hypothetical protein
MDGRMDELGFYGLYFPLISHVNFKVISRWPKPFFQGQYVLITGFSIATSLDFEQVS